MYKNRKAVSPVIATVILVAVAITISVAVAYWMGGISSQYTKFEKVEVSSAVCDWDSTNLRWTVTLTLKNTGTSTCTITNAYVNDRDVSTYGDATGVLAQNGNASTDIEVAGRTLSSGGSTSVHIYISHSGSGGTFEKLSAGTTINLKFHSAGGMDYLKLVELV
jgi:flagellin-like protein